MIKKITAAVLALSLIALSGCSGGSIYSNYREIEQLVVIQTMGIDKTDNGVCLSISSGSIGGGSSGSGDGGAGGGVQSILRMSAKAQSLTVAQERIQDYSPGEQLFFGHVNYIALGQSALESGVNDYFDYIKRDTSFRLNIPAFAVSGGEAAELVLGTGSDDYDATNALRSIERNLLLRGDSYLFTAAQIAANMDANGAALISAVRCVDAKESDYEAEEGELTTLPDGYIIIKDGKSAGHIPFEMAQGVNILRSEAGPSSVELDGATVQLDKCKCEIKPVLVGGALAGLDISVTADAALAELRQNRKPEELSAELETEIKSWIVYVLDKSLETGCDFLQLGSLLEMQEPRFLHGMTEDFSGVLSNIYYNVRVQADVSRSFDLDVPEDGHEV